MASNNWIDYSKAPLQDEPYSGFFENVLKGYQMANKPREMKAEQEAKAEQLKGLTLGNKIKAFDLENKPAELEAQRKYKQALTDLAMARIKKVNQPGAGKPLDIQKAIELRDTYPEGSKKWNDVDAVIKKMGGANQGKGNTPLKPNGHVANEEYVWQQEHPDPDQLTEEQKKEHLSRIKLAQKLDERRVQVGNERQNVLNDTQYERGLSQVTRKHNELRQIEEGYFPGTKTKLTAVQQDSMRNDILLSLVKDTTDPKTREKLINATNMNITLDSIDPVALTTFSGAQGRVDKLGDSIKESLGADSPRYEAYIKEVNKAMAGAKQMRQYLGDSIQPSAQERLDHLTNPEAWNVSPKVAKENFEFIKDLYKRETQTLVRAATDPTLYKANFIGNNTAPQQLTNQQSTGQFDWNKYPVAGR